MTDYLAANRAALSSFDLGPRPVEVEPAMVDVLAWWSGRGPSLATERRRDVYRYVLRSKPGPHDYRLHLSSKRGPDGRPLIESHNNAGRVPGFVDVRAVPGAESKPKHDGHPFIRLQARGCGELYFVRATCADPLCVDCMKRKGAAERRRWQPVLERMHSPKLLTLTIRNTATARAGRDELQRAFRSFCELSLGPRGLPGLLAEAQAFVAESPDDMQRARFAVELDRLEARIVRKWRKSDRPVRMRDLLGDGWRAIEVTWSESAGWHWHIHAALDMPYIPQPFIVAAWKRATGGTSQVCDVRAIGQGAEDIAEVCKYVSKVWELPDEMRRGELRLALYGMQRVKAIGGAVPVESHACPCCGGEHCTAKRASGELRTIRVTQTDDGQRRALVDVAGVDGG